MTQLDVVALGELADRLGLGLLETQDSRVTYANAVFHEIVGRSLQTIDNSVTAIELVSARSRARLAALYDLGSVQAMNISEELELLTAEGSYVPVDVSLSLSPAPDGTVRALALVTDGRARRAARTVLDRSLAVLDRIPGGILVWDGAGADSPLTMRLEYSNEWGRRLLRRIGDASSHPLLRDVFPDVDRGDAARLFALRGTDRFEEFGEVVFGIRQGSPRRFRWQAFGLPQLMIGVVFEDVTAHHAEEARRRALLRRLVEISDEERRRLAMDLHDDAVQEIAAAAILVQGLRARPDGPGLEDRLALAQAALQEAMTGLRRLVFELSPPELVESGLESAIRSAAEHVFGWTTTTVSIEVVLDHELPVAVSTAAYRIIAEAMTNVRKHANATRIEIAVRQAGPEVSISIIDDGGGIAGVPEPGHLGIRSMQERASAQGGSCVVGPNSSGGVSVEVVLPTADLAVVGVREELRDASDALGRETELRQQLERAWLEMGDARRAAWRATHRLKTAMEFVKELLDSDAAVDGIVRVAATYLGRALQAACVIELFEPEVGWMPLRSIWHADPSRRRAVELWISDRTISGHVRTAIAGGTAVLVASLPTGSPRLQSADPPHSLMIVPVSDGGDAIGLCLLLRDQEPESFGEDDIEFVACMAAQVAHAIARARDR